MANFDFPTEVIDLPSKGWFYDSNNSLSSGQVEIYHMTARHEDILTSTNLISKGLVFDKLLEALIVNKDIKLDDILGGDKDAIMVASRIIAYGKDYPTNFVCPKCRTENEVKIDLQEIDFKQTEFLVENKGHNEFSYHLSACNKDITFKLLTQRDEKMIQNQIDIMGKNQAVKKEVTTRLAYMILSVDGNRDKENIRNFCDVIPARDSLEFKKHIQKVSPGLDMFFKFECTECGHKEDRVEVPLGVNFFWPNISV